MYISNYVCLFSLFQIAYGNGVVYFKRTPQTIVNDQFKLCFGSEADECLELSRPLYEYYIRSNLALVNNEQPPVPQEDHTGLRNTADSLMFEFLNGEELEDLNCIPYVSSYTDCTRENICTGCQTCTCDSLANWKCKMTMRCDPEPKLTINTKVLQSILDSLNTDDETVSERSKREIKIPHLIDYGFIVKWLYDNDRLKRASLKNNIQSNKENKYEYDTITLNEVLNSITNEENYTRRKALEYDIKDNDATNENTTLHSNNESVNLNIVTNVEETDSAGRASNVIIDLLNGNSEDEPAKRKQDPKLVKRDTPATETSEIEVSDSIKKLKEDILYPLTSIIDSKQKEIDKLLKIRKKLIRFLMAHKSLDTKQSNNTNETSESPYISIYKIEVLPENLDIDTEFKNTNNSGIVDQFFTKLKRDIYEVIKDIVGIQKYSNSKTLPQDLKVLIRAMRYYVRHQDELLFSGQKISKKGTIPTKTDLQLTNLPNSKENKIDTTYIKENLKMIIKAISDTPISDAIDNLSPDTYKIVQRFIKENYNKVYSNDFNLTIDIKNVGSHWNQIMKDAEGASALDKLSYMKLLYMVLISDMNKVNHAMHVLEFARNRRMTIDGNLVPFLTKRINVALTRITGRLNKMIKLNSKASVTGNHAMHHLQPTQHPYVHNPPRLVKIHRLSENNPIKKDSMLRHIKDMLKTSKHEIVDLIRSKIPKSEIIKSIAKKKFGMLSNEQRIQDVMETWQRNLNVTSSRTKRDTKKKAKKKNKAAKPHKKPAPKTKVTRKKIITKKKKVVIKQKPIVKKTDKLKKHKLILPIIRPSEFEGSRLVYKFVKNNFTNGNYKNKTPSRLIGKTKPTTQLKYYQPIVKATVTKSTMLKETTSSYEDYLQIPTQDMSLNSSETSNEYTMLLE